LWKFGIFSPILVYCTRKNLATLAQLKIYSYLVPSTMYVHYLYIREHFISQVSWYHGSLLGFDIIKCDILSLWQSNTSTKWNFSNMSPRNIVLRHFVIRNSSIPQLGVRNRCAPPLPSAPVLLKRVNFYSSSAVIRYT
jgi:hypothetical protein